MSSKQHTRTPHSEAADIQRALHGKIQHGLELDGVEPAKEKDGELVENRFLVTLRSKERYHGQSFIYAVRVHGTAAKVEPAKVAAVISADAAETMQLSLKHRDVEPPEPIEV
jgi:hypothetical protein